jgi:hypothetical protein
VSAKNEPPGRGIESRFRDLSADVRQERLVRYIVHQVGSGRHIDDILKDPYVAAHSDDITRSRILEHPEVIEGIEKQIRRQFAGYGDSVGETERGAGGESPDEVTTDIAAADTAAAGETAKSEGGTNA